MIALRSQRMLLGGYEYTTGTETPGMGVQHQ